MAFALNAFQDFAVAAANRVPAAIAPHLYQSFLRLPQAAVVCGNLRFIVLHPPIVSQLAGLLAEGAVRVGFESLRVPFDLTRLDQTHQFNGRPPAFGQANNLLVAVGVGFKPLLDPQDVGLGHGALNLPAVSQIGQHSGDIGMHLLLVRRIGNRQHAVVRVDLQIGFGRAFIQSQTQFGLGGQRMIGHHFRARRRRLKIGKFRHGAQNAGRIGKPHIFQIEESIEIIGVLAIDAVDVVDPLGKVCIQLSQVFLGLVGGQVQGPGRPTDPDFLGGRQPHPQPVADTRQQQMTGPAVIDEVSLARLFTQGRREQGKVEILLPGQLFGHGRCLDHGHLQPPGLDAPFTGQIDQLFAAEHWPIGLACQRLGQLLSATLVHT